METNNTTNRNSLCEWSTPVIANLLTHEPMPIASVNSHRIPLGLSFGTLPPPTVATSMPNAHTHTHTHKQTQTWTHARIHILNTYVRAHIHTYKHKWMHAYVDRYIHTYTHTCIHTLFTYAHTNTCTFIHTYNHACMYAERGTSGLREGQGKALALA